MQAAARSITELVEDAVVSSDLKVISDHRLGVVSAVLLHVEHI